jgi:hypothetical protein
MCAISYDGTDPADYFEQNEQTRDWQTAQSQ